MELHLGKTTFFPTSSIFLPNRQHEKQSAFLFLALLVLSSRWDTLKRTSHCPMPSPVFEETCGSERMERRVETEDELS